jgi:hypothetical protein
MGLRLTKFEDIEKALIKARGIMTRAAKTLGVPTGELREFVKGKAVLQKIIFEAREELCDLAEANMHEALTDKDDPARRDAMTRFMLNSALASKRGFGAREDKSHPLEPPQRIIIGYAGEPGFGPPVDTGEASFPEKLAAWHSKVADKVGKRNDPARDVMMEEHAERTRQREESEAAAQQEPTPEPQIEIFLPDPTEAPRPAEPQCEPVVAFTIPQEPEPEPQREPVIIDVTPLPRIEPELPDVGPEIRLTYKTEHASRLHLGNQDAHALAYDQTVRFCEAEFGLDLEAAKLTVQAARRGEPVRARRKPPPPPPPAREIGPSHPAIEYPREGLTAPRCIWPVTATPTSCEPIPGPTGRLTRGRGRFMG